jgi:hypothetical protein
MQAKETKVRPYRVTTFFRVYSKAKKINLSFNTNHKKILYLIKEYEFSKKVEKQFTLKFLGISYVKLE